MTADRAKVKAEVMQEMEGELERLLDWMEGTPKPTLTEMEEVMLKFRKRVTERVTERLLEAQEASRPVPGPSCPRCGREMLTKGRKSRPVESRVGRLEVQRTYYYCPTCQAGLFPPGSAAGAEGSDVE